jgi:2-iminobutanoate/2-iminopropanoate deaminase
VDLLKHLPSPIAPTFSEALRIDTRAGSWIFISGQVGVPLPPDKGSVTFEQEVRTTFERIRDSLGKLGAGMNHVVSIKTYLTDLGPYAVFSRIRGEFFPKDPPTSTAVQVAGLLLNAKTRSTPSPSCPLAPPRESNFAANVTPLMLLTTNGRWWSRISG